MDRKIPEGRKRDNDDVFQEKHTDTLANIVKYATFGALILRGTNFL